MSDSADAGMESRNVCQHECARASTVDNACVVLPRAQCIACYQKRINCNRLRTLPGTPFAGSLIVRNVLLKFPSSSANISRTSICLARTRGPGHQSWNLRLRKPSRNTQEEIIHFITPSNRNLRRKASSSRTTFTKLQANVRQSKKSTVACSSSTIILETRCYYSFPPETLQVTQRSSDATEPRAGRCMAK